MLTLLLTVLVGLVLTFVLLFLVDEESDYKVPFLHKKQSCVNTSTRFAFKLDSLSSTAKRAKELGALVIRNICRLYDSLSDNNNNTNNKMRA